MDEIENDFEFRPITEGLGFHRKVKSIRDEIDGVNLAREELAMQIPDTGRVSLETEKEKTLADLMTSLGSKMDFVQAQPPKATATAAAPATPAASMKTTTATTESTTTELQRDMHLCPISFSFSAMVFDAVMAFALSLLFLIALVIATDMDLNRLLQATSLYTMNQIGMLVLYISVAQLYVISARAFAGQTLGEWAFDVQLGTREDQEQATFPLLVFARAVLISLTGVVILPLIALIFGVDYAAKVLSLRLYRAE